MANSINFGQNMDVVFQDGQAIKTHKQALSYEVAQQGVDELWQYADLLAAEPIATPAFHGASVIELEDGYHMQYRTDQVTGASIDSLPHSEQLPFLSQIIGNVAAMTATDVPDELKVGVDAKTANWHLDDGSPVLVDLYPPIFRNDQGRLTTGMVEYSPSDQRYMATKSGVISRILYSAIAVTSPRINGKHVREVMGADLAWCHDLIPEGLDPGIGRRVHREINLHFAPMLAGRAKHRIGRLLTKATSR